MTDHPLYRMWKEQLDRELAREAARAVRIAAREQERASWYQAWESYKARLSDTGRRQPLPRWWNLIGWARWLLRLHAPGRPDRDT
jgi:hypothetical protein